MKEVVSTPARSGGCFPEGTLQMNRSDSRSPCTHTLPHEKKRKKDRVMINVSCVPDAHVDWWLGEVSCRQLSHRKAPVFSDRIPVKLPPCLRYGGGVTERSQNCVAQGSFPSTHMTTDPSILNSIMSSLPQFSSSHWQGYTAVQ